MRSMIETYINDKAWEDGMLDADQRLRYSLVPA